MELPEPLVEDIRLGRVVLVLGAGASMGARDSDGNEPPSATDLRNLLADQFLGGKYKEDPLAWVADLSISETDLIRVQDFVAGLLRGLRPAPFHSLLPSFKWRGIATTNYDLVIEAAYAAGGSVQELAPIISDRDRIDEKLRGPNMLGLLKLHGCITRTHDPDLPLILTADQYLTHRNNRHLLFRTLEDWAYEYPIVFIGFGGQDPDIRAILQEVSRDQALRPRYYLIKRTVPPPESRFWETKKVTAIEGTFEEFLLGLDARLPAALRSLSALIHSEHPIRRRFVVPEDLGAALKSFLASDVEYVHGSMPTPNGDANAFYRGFDLGWYPILTKLDVRRTLADTLLNDVIIRSEEERPSKAELHVVKAEAGAGKTVFLRRLALEAAVEADVLCLYANPFGILRIDSFKELYRVTRQRIFLFVDNAADRASHLSHLLLEARRERLPLTIITAERVNIWNTSCERLAPLLTESYSLWYLNHKEVEALVTLLGQHNSLGPHLQGKSFAECVRQFEEQAGRQLLVALHEATMGQPFEEILLHEYNQIQPAAARQLYLTVCVLNRLNVAVRAGLIARVHGIPFELFKEKFFAPLEHVVNSSINDATRDYYYVARHAEIAQIVFDRVLRSVDDRFNEYVRIIKNMNLAYNTDRAAFRQMLRAKAVHELFPNYEQGRAVFEAAKEMESERAFLLQQEAIYEKIRPNGNLNTAEEFLRRARDLDPRDMSLVHTLAELMLARADRAEHPLEREKYRNDCRGLLRPLLGDHQHGRYARHTLVKISLQELRDILGTAGSSDRQIDDAIRSVEDVLQKGHQLYPSDPLLLGAEAELRQLMDDHERAFIALRRAFEANKRDPYIAGRLSRIYESREDIESAKEVLRTALEGNRGDKELNFRYGMILRKSSGADYAALVYHFQRAFTKWDTNYEGQFWFARYAYESQEAKIRQESKEVFHHLRESSVSHDARVNVRDSICDGSGERVFTGRIARMECAYGFVERDGLADWIFFHRSESDHEGWESLSIGLRVKFNVGFNLSGPIALKVEAI